MRCSCWPARRLWRVRCALSILAALSLAAGPATATAADADAEPAPHAPAAVAPEMGGALYGLYPMTREASGTSWQPDTAEMQGLHFEGGPWTIMAHGVLSGVYTDQGGPRGSSQLFNESLAMLTARHDGGADVLSVRAMGSLEPLNGPRGYPLLFQTGETADGRQPLVDRQHPHNLLLEAALAYSRQLSATSSAFVYAGPVGEPALGPPAFMHRGSSADNPEAPLTHHWLDATHVSFGVVTLGGIWRNWKLEGSAFNGREPDQHRYGVQLRGLDSTAVRLSYNPTAALSLQLSSGRLASPEQLEPAVAVRRSTASAIYDRVLETGHWQTTLAWGRNAPEGARASDGYLLDSALSLGASQRLYARLEQVVKDELFQPPAPLAGQAFQIRKASLGYLVEFAAGARLRIGVGGVYSRYFATAALDRAYGQDPESYTLFVRLRLAD